MDALSISVISLIVLVIISFVFLPVLRHKLSVRDGMKFYFDGRYQLFVFAHSRFDKVREGKQVYERYRDFVKALYNKDTGGWNYKGGTFGKFRNGNQNNHNGIDFAAAPGTPIYAPYDGTVIATRTNAPNFHEEKKVGNYITIESVIDGKKVQFKFCHLNYGTPIASNPMNGGNPYTAGDKVRAGDLIGFSGKTGNAWKDSEVPYKHVHLETRVNNALVNPIDYINGKLSADYSTIVNIKCDDLSNSKK